MSDEIKRWLAGYCGGPDMDECMREHKNGSYVTYADHLAAIVTITRERDALKSALKDRIETLELTSKRLSDEGKLEHWNRICEVHYIVDHLLPKEANK